MKSKRNFKIIIFLLISILFVSIGYAAISGIGLTINGTATAESSGFAVRFSSSSNDMDAYSKCLSTDGTITDCALIANQQVTSDRTASFDIRQLKGYGDTATVTFKILNESVNGSSASLSVSATTNSNSEYFDLSTSLSSSTIAPNQYSILTIKVKVIKVLYTSDSQTTSVTVTVTPTEI